jgi:hypothetical protein
MIRLRCTIVVVIANHGNSSTTTLVLLLSKDQTLLLCYQTPILGLHPTKRHQDGASYLSILSLSRTLHTPFVTQFDFWPWLLLIHFTSKRNNIIQYYYHPTVTYGGISWHISLETTTTTNTTLKKIRISRRQFWHLTRSKRFKIPSPGGGKVNLWKLFKRKPYDKVYMIWVLDVK